MNTRGADYWMTAHRYDYQPDQMWKHRVRNGVGRPPRVTNERMDRQMARDLTIGVAVRYNGERLGLQQLFKKAPVRSWGMIVPPGPHLYGPGCSRVCYVVARTGLLRKSKRRARDD